MWQDIQYHNNKNTSEVCNDWGPPIFWVLADIYQAGMLTPDNIVIRFTRGLPMYSVIKKSPDM